MKLRDNQSVQSFIMYKHIFVVAKIQILLFSKLEKKKNPNLSFHINQ